MKNLKNIKLNNENVIAAYNISFSLQTKKIL